MSGHTSPKWRLSSLRQLVLLAFLAVVAPFGVLTYYATDQLVDQSSQGRILAQQALEVTRRGQQLEQLAEDITRAARQFEILQRPDIRQRLLQLLEDYENTLRIHAPISSEPTLVQQIRHLLEQYHNSPQEQKTDLQLLTRQLNRNIDEILDGKLQRLNQVAQDTQNQLGLLTLLLLGLSALLMAFFSHSIIRPVNRIARRIRAMGTGESYVGGSVGGPEELVSLEQQLNWLSEQLTALDEQKLKFLRHMSHELKTPLSTLREGSDLLAEQVTGPLNADQQEIASLLQSNARQLQSLIEQLLDYNRIHQHEPVQLKETPLIPLIQSACEPHKLLLEQKKIHLILPHKDLTWRTDAEMLLRILGNLIGNAAQYGDPEGELKIQCFRQEDQLILDVKNSGPTIPEEDVPHLFQPFYQGQNRRAGPVRGSGIGLSIVQDAATALGGEVSLHHNNRRQVCFRLCLNHVDNSQDDA